MRNLAFGLFVIALGASVAIGVARGAQAEARVVLLGTGTPVPDGERSGPGLAVIEKAMGVDVLVHEAISEAGWEALTPDWQAYHRSAHTLTSERADITNQTQPGVLVPIHIRHYGAPIGTARTEIGALNDGKVVLGNDLDEF